MLLVANEQARGQLGDAGGALKEINTELKNLLAAGDLDVVRERMPSLLERSELATAELAAKDPAIQPKAPDADAAQKIATWRTTNPRAEMALHFIRTTTPVERAMVIKQIAEELGVPPSAIAHTAASQAA
jgi:hypothetical protein